MAKEQSLLVRICDWLARYSIFAAVFLTPLFFLPWTADVLEFNKQALLLVLLCVSLFAWMLKTLMVGKFSITKFELNSIGLTHIAVGVLFLVALLATIFSVFPYGSFWGWPQVTSESLLTLICVCVGYFLISNILNRKDIFGLVLTLSVSVVISQLIGVLDLFGLFIIPFGFAKSVAFNTIGSSGSLGILSAVLLPLAIAMLIATKKWWKALFIAQLVLSIILFVLIDYPIVWWVVIASSALVMIFGVIKRGFFDGRWMAVPMFFLTIALFFTLLNPQANWLPHGANEIFLSQGSNLQISLNSLKERPIFGSGIGTFGYDFSKFKDSSFFNTNLWDVGFSRGTSKVLNDLATTGILGLLALLALMAIPVFYSVKHITTAKARGEDANEILYWMIAMGLTVGLISQAVAYFLYNSNICLDLVWFFAIAGLVNITTNEKTQYELKSSSLLTLLVTFSFTLVFIFGLGILILDTQRYVAEVQYYNGLTLLQNSKVDAGTKQLEGAASTNYSSDLYFRQLAQVYLANFQAEAQKPSLTNKDDETKKVQGLISNAINAGKIATDINPKSSGDWSVRGYVYQNLIGFISDAQTWAITSYDEALKLAPNDPYLLAQEGSVYFVASNSLTQDQQSQKPDLLNKAKEKLELATKYNPNYSNGLFTLGLVYEALGQADKTMATFQKIQQINPTSKDIATIISNLKAGKSALSSSVTPPANTPPDTTPVDSSAKNPASSADTTKTGATKTK
jgi:tetratricopeptide (TPR) repeat protein